MGVDYVIDRDCGPKQRHSVDGLVALMKSRSAAEMVIAQVRAGGDTRPLDQVSITRVLRRPEGDTEVAVKLSELIASSAVLDTERADCQQCPANRGASEFGCSGYIHYPIAASAERWLMGRLADDLESPALKLLAAAIRDFDYTGTPSERMRSHGDTFFELHPAPVRTWGKKRLFRGHELTVSSDQLFHMMFHVGPIEPTHAAMVCAFFGVIRFDQVRDRDALGRAHLDLPDDPAAAELGQFLLALAYAAAHELTVSVSA